MNGVYEPRVFDAATIAQAKRVILTAEASTTEERWAKETPYLAELAGSELRLGRRSVVLDYGCGIGRLAKALIERFGCRVVGVDISASMRALAVGYVDSDRFFAAAPAMLDMLTERGVLVDAALAVWVLQHCERPAEDIARLHRAVRPEGALFVVNNRQRAVPMVLRRLGPAGATAEGRWVDDGIDIQAELGRRFAARKEGRLAAESVAANLPALSWWASFEARLLTATPSASPAGSGDSNEK